MSAMESVSVRTFTSFSPLTRNDWIGVVILAILASTFYALTINRSAYDYILRADEGYSFSAAVRVSEGLIPQKDFSYAYGPLMPYLYAGAFKVWGTSIPVMRAVWASGYTASIVLFFFIGREVLPTWLATTFAVSLIGQIHTPLYSYNHIGLMLVVQLQVLASFQVLRAQPSAFYKWLWCIGTLFTLELLIKFNEAVAVFVFLSIGLGLWHWLSGRSQDELERKSWGNSWKTVSLVSVIPLLIFVSVTVLLNRHLTADQFYRNFPLLPEYHASVGGYSFVWMLLARPFRLFGVPNSPWTWYSLWFENYYYAVCAALVCGLLAVLGLGALLFSSSLKHAMTVSHWAGVLIGCVSLGLYHEFFLTGNHWSTPMYVGFCSLFVIWIVYLATRKHRVLTMGWAGIFLAIALTSAAIYMRVATTYFSQYALDLDRDRIFSSSESDAPVISKVVHYLDTNTPQESSLVAFPHDSLLIHLASRANAMRDDDYQWMLFPTEKSDQEVVDELESKQVHGVLISNFVGFRGMQRVRFGVDYLTRTSKYLHEHYHPVKNFLEEESNYAVTYYLRNDSAAGAFEERSEQQQ
jgi:hypothetical protein